MAFLIFWSIVFLGVIGWALWWRLFHFAGILAFVPLYLLSYAYRQRKGHELAVRITDRSVFHDRWVPNDPDDGGFPGGKLRIEDIGSVECSLGPAAARSSRMSWVTVWLNDPSKYLSGMNIDNPLANLLQGGDVLIACYETDKSSEEVKDAIEQAMADHYAAQNNRS